ncbi:hypothetical protein A3L02_09955 [Thermococcus celer Vu 13 = JCM 8558]|uniref:Uncharacterized protein n=1 Tax=Thermococcus celer Vu 13 = JCM 8558 TaxID=1293037 RepID=A0A218P4L3_THECE|nr:hypothetical protein A3L02_09955 [Thermococcus celer Vu 13 = JCM 8558]
MNKTLCTEIFGEKEISTEILGQKEGCTSKIFYTLENIKRHHRIQMKPIDPVGRALSEKSVITHQITLVQIIGPVKPGTAGLNT